MNFLRFLFFIGALFILIGLSSSFASREEVDGSQSFLRAKVIDILEQGEQDIGIGERQFVQKIKVKILSGEQSGNEIIIEHGSISTIDEAQKLNKGDTVVFTKIGEDEYYVVDKYRLTPLFFIFFIFVAITLALARWQGLFSIMGLVVSIIVISAYIVPSILKGDNPIFVSLTGACVIVIVALYLAHGFNKRTTIALISTLITLFLSSVMSVVFVSLAKLAGLGSEDALFVQVSTNQNINMTGLLLGGIIIGALGVLDDITTSQAAAVDEIKKANPTLSSSELYKRGLSVGREHIASLVNTLVLAYAGAGLPLFLLFAVNKSEPWWVTLNSEFIAEEIVRAIVGSITLILAVPITTYLAARFLRQKKDTP